MRLSIDNDVGAILFMFALIAAGCVLILILGYFWPKDK